MSFKVGWRQEKTLTTEHSNVQSGGSQKLRGLNIWAQLGGNKLETTDQKKKTKNKKTQKTRTVLEEVVLNKLGPFSDSKHSRRGSIKAVPDQGRRHCRLGDSRAAD